MVRQRGGRVWRRGAEQRQRSRSEIPWGAAAGHCCREAAETGAKDGPGGKEQSSTPVGDRLEQFQVEETLRRSVSESNHAPGTGGRAL